MSHKISEEKFQSPLPSELLQLYLIAICSAIGLRVVLSLMCGTPLSQVFSLSLHLFTPFTLIRYHLLALVPRVSYRKQSIGKLAVSRCAKLTRNSKANQVWPTFSTLNTPTRLPGT